MGLAVPLFLIAMWVRTPALPRTAGVKTENGGERIDAAESAIRGLERSLSETRQRLDERAANALNAPADQQAAFDFLSKRSPQRDGESVILFDHGRPLAWSGVMRADVDSLTAPISVTFNPFYITLNVARSNGARRAVASIVLQAAPPADRLTQSVEDRLAPRTHSRRQKVFGRGRSCSCRTVRQFCAPCRIWRQRRRLGFDGRRCSAPEALSRSSSW